MRYARLVHVALFAAFFLACMVAPAFAEGYNRDLAKPIAPEGSRAGWGYFIDDIRYQYQGYYTVPTYYPDGGWFGPHGGYTTTTNKCQDCHSTHYAAGSYMLLRADTRAQACDFCHGGGGGANVNIMMDNEYAGTSEEIAASRGSAFVPTTGRGLGTGHTLGYSGRAPVDIKPAYETSEFSCFDCHSPHGNSARVMGVFHNQGRLVWPAPVRRSVHLQFDFLGDITGEFSLDPIRVYVQDYDIPVPSMEYVDLVPPDLAGEPDTEGFNMVWGLEFTPGERSPGNIVFKYDFTLLGIGMDEGTVVVRKPIFPAGRFLLLKNPDNENGVGREGDLLTETTDIEGRDVVTDGSNKVAIDWDNPLGPAVSWITKADPSDPDPDWVEYTMMILYAANDERNPYPWFITGEYDENRPGIATIGEFCTDCHGGAAGLSTQAAEVWFPEIDDYIIAYSHDSQPRGCDRQLILNAGDENNFGPTCRECHSGAGSCAQCHADPALGKELNPDITLADVWDWESYEPNTEGVSPFVAQPSYMKEGRVSAIAAQCLDGGFSFPHRTLGYRMLKDSLWGIDFDGTPLAPGAIRGEGMLLSDDLFIRGNYPVRYALEDLVDVETHNLDSACLDCHNPTIWNGDDPAYFVQIDHVNWYKDIGYRVDGAADGWSVSGWELLFKGLP